jgi:hypothetical protein
MSKNIYIFLSAALSLVVGNMTYQFLVVIARDTVNGLEKSPYQYRVLFSYLWHPLAEAIGGYVAAWLFWFICFSLLAFLIDEIGELIAPDPEKVRFFLLAGYVIVPALIFFHPAPAFGNIIEAIFLAASLLVILRGRIWWLYPLVALASLNRETAVFIPLMAFFILRDWKHAAGLFLVWAVTYGGIRLLIGPVPVHVTLAEILEKNLGSGFWRFVLGLPLIAWLFWYAAKGWRAAPQPLQRAAYVIPFYLLSVAVFGVWHEWRLMLTLYPLLIPLAGVTGPK